MASLLFANTRVIQEHADLVRQEYLLAQALYDTLERARAEAELTGLPDERLQFLCWEASKLKNYFSGMSVFLENMSDSFAALSLEFSVLLQNARSESDKLFRNVLPAYNLKRQGT